MFQQKPQAFLALPLKDPFSSVLAEQIGQALRQRGIEPVLPTEFGTDGTVRDQIQGAIHRAKLVVADLTGSNPNVLFELGMAMGLSKPVLLISQDPIKDVPFDLQAHQVAVYRSTDVTTVRRYVEAWLRDFLARE